MTTTTTRTPIEAAALRANDADAALAATQSLVESAMAAMGEASRAAHSADMNHGKPGVSHLAREDAGRAKAAARLALNAAVEADVAARAEQRTAADEFAALVFARKAARQSRAA